MSLPIPSGPGEITAGWLSRALGHTVSDVSLTRIGEDEGFTGGGLYRLEMAGGGSLIAKLSPADPQMRATFASANAREVGFYTRIAPGLPVPDCLYGACDAETGASILLLQDLGRLRAGLFVEGLGVDDARALMAALAEIHAAWWGAPVVSGLSGAAIVREFSFAGAWAAYPQALARLLPDIELPEAFLALGAHIAAHPDEVFGALLEQGPLTVLHRDCHVDNVMFDARGCALILDWQIMGKGRGTYDVAYSLISSLPAPLRRRAERDLVAFYHSELIRGGVTGYGAAQCWEEYRRAVISKLFASVVATVLLDNSGLAKQAWRRADLVRLLAFCADHALTPADFWA